MQGKSRESPARFRILDDKFEMDNVRFEDEGLITCHAENMFGVEVSKLNDCFRWVSCLFQKVAYQE